MKEAYPNTHLHFTTDQLHSDRMRLYLFWLSHTNDTNLLMCSLCSQYL